MSENDSTYPKEFLDHLNSITNKRARVIIDHIMEHGFITTEDLETKGYSHPPRAARDVREVGIPLETFKVKSHNNKSIAAYRFGDIAQFQQSRVAGRVLFSKKFKKELYDLCKGRCFICNGEFEERYLQVDHRVPYQIGGDINLERKTDGFMLLCGPCNRAKSWSCEGFYRALGTLNLYYLSNIKHSHRNLWRVTSAGLESYSKEVHNRWGAAYCSPYFF